MLLIALFSKEQGRKRPLDTLKRMIERKKGRRRDIEREGEIREREVKGAQSKPNPSPNAFLKLCEWFSGRFLLKGRNAHGFLFERKILVKSPELRNRAQRKVDYTNYYAITMRRNYFRKLSPKIMSENYQLVYNITRKMWKL